MEVLSFLKLNIQQFILEIKKNINSVISYISIDINDSLILTIGAKFFLICITEFQNKHSF